MLSIPNEDGRPLAPKLRLNKRFQPCPVEPEDELYPNGIFVFNITRLQAFIDAHLDQFPAENIAVADLSAIGASGLDEDAVLRADLSRPILLAEISPGRYNVIDGNHRVGRARRDGLATVPGRRIASPVHIVFLTSGIGYERYVEYWNGKVREMERDRHRLASAAGRTTGHLRPSPVGKR